jgi:alkylation response protein AidB-like acyl-CoA dehydrogenase
MADFGATELDTFRAEARAWLEENCPKSIRRTDEVDWETAMIPVKPTDDAQLWKDRIVAKGWGTPTWPKEYGGGGLSQSQGRVLQREMERSARRTRSRAWAPACSATPCWNTAPRRRSCAI